jgi:hypothetical protein
MRFDKFYFERFNDAPFNFDNPRYVLSLDGVDNILTKIVSCNPYTLGIQDFENFDLVKKLMHIDVLKINNDKLALAIPVFVEQDLAYIKNLCLDVSKEICNVLINEKVKIEEIVGQVNNGSSNKVNLYHLLCGSIFDGRVFEFLEENHLVTVSKAHQSGLDYLVIMYENSDKLSAYSNKLLCSYNRLITKEGTFSSFGDSDGKRKDLYRYLRLEELNQLNDDQKRYIDFEKDELANAYNMLLEGKQISEKYLEIFEYFGYCNEGAINVPVYDERANKIVDNLYNVVLNAIKPILVKALSNIKQADGLLAIRHNVDIFDIGNEIYHLLFGQVNEQLIEIGLVAQPIEKAGEGRYLKCYEKTSNEQNH